MNNIQPQLLDDEISFKLYSLNRLIQQAYQDYLVPDRAGYRFWHAGLHACAEMQTLFCKRREAT